jgi:hypothetical protein
MDPSLTELYISPIIYTMKTLVLAVCLFGSLLLQGCYAYVEPAGGYYIRDGFWYYRDGDGRERHEHGRFHHREHEHHDEH